MDRITTIIFDLDDTLHDDSTSFHRAALYVAQQVADRYDIDPHKLGQQYIEQAQAFWQELTPEDFTAMSNGVRAKFWGKALAQWGIANRELAGWCAYAYEHERERILHMEPSILAMLTDLRARSFVLGLLTNGLAFTHRNKIARLGLEGYFDGIFLADEIGMVKPDPKIFLHVCDVLGSIPRHTMMVGDRYDRDVIGAKQAGLYAVWLDIGRDMLPPDVPPPDAVITNVLEVPTLLASNVAL